MSALAIIAGTLNISAKHASSKQMEEFIHLILDIGIQIQLNFKYA